MQVTVIPAVDPAAVRAATGLNPKGSWYSPRKRRPGAFAALHGAALDDSQTEGRG